MLELGILGKVDEIPDEMMRFYALIGLCVSTATAIDHHLFDCYRSTSGLNQKFAAETYYKNIKFSYRRDLADDAVKATLAKSSLLTSWNEIIGQVQAVCGPDGARNLVSHNPLNLYVYVRKNADGAPDMIDNSALYAELAVSQNYHAVAAGKRRPAKQTFASLKSHVYDLCGAELRLGEFYRSHLATRA